MFGLHVSPYLWQAVEQDAPCVPITYEGGFVGDTDGDGVYVGVTDDVAVTLGVTDGEGVKLLDLVAVRVTVEVLVAEYVDVLLGVVE